MGNGHILAQTSHVHFFIRMYRMNDTTSAKEQASLEHSVCEQVVHSGHIAKAVNVSILLCHCNLAKFGVGHANAKRNEHETDL